MVPVESSHVDSVGYDPDRKLLRIFYRDGASYDHEDITPEFHAALMAAPSKGGFLTRHLKGGVRHDGLRIKEPAPSSPHLNTFEHDPCCDANLVIAARAGKLADVESWTCPKCGCEWRCRVVGNIRHWEPHELIAVLRV